MNPERQSGHTQNPAFPIHSVSTGLCCLWHAAGTRNTLSTSVCPIGCVAPAQLPGQSRPTTALGQGLQSGSRSQELTPFLSGGTSQPSK